MTEQLITLETAEQALLRGFDWIRGLGKLDMMGQEILCSQSLLQKWLRDEHKIDINIDRGGKEGHYIVFIHRYGYIYEGDGPKLFSSYEEALEEGLKQALLLLEDSSGN